ncbi:hypothetical protein F5050DRAFT_1903835 [Lentinula boryana]|uniref:Uncharacterized protein n=1 Tax=Lentinula boryana TaxID=40481 RepID=A0ABQ8Q8S0_9AGAR|nr:hypothetical protein F5050DRAFT_1903835 [Lentinula boryana]
MCKRIWLRGALSAVSSIKMHPRSSSNKEIAAAEEIWQALANAERGERWLRDFVGYREETWVPAAHYEAAKAIGQEVKQRILKACAKKTYAVAEANWLLDDMDEDKLEEYK